MYFLQIKNEHPVNVRFLLENRKNVLHIIKQEQSGKDNPNGRKPGAATDDAIFSRKTNNPVMARKINPAAYKSENQVYSFFILL